MSDRHKNTTNIIRDYIPKYSTSNFVLHIEHDSNRFRPRGLTTTNKFRQPTTKTVTYIYRSKMKKIQNRESRRQKHASFIRFIPQYTK